VKPMMPVVSWVVVASVFSTLILLRPAATPTLAPQWDLQSDGSYKIHRDVPAPRVAVVASSKPRSRVDECLAVLGAIDLANGRFDGTIATLTDRLNWCKANAANDDGH
jgi:hypothetical protein